MQYTRQTLQQYTNGATLRGMTTKQERALKNMHSSSSAANTELPGVSGEQKISPQMLYMQNLTRIVLLTIESLQQQGLVPPRSVLIPQMRQSFGMAEAGAVPQNMYAQLLHNTSCYAVSYLAICSVAFFFRALHRHAKRNGHPVW